MDTPTVKNFLQEFKRHAVYFAAIPFDYAHGWPSVTLRNGQLCLTVPFYRLAAAPGDQTLLFPLSYLVTVTWPQRRIVRFENLAYNSAFQGVEFEKPVGKFRHEAIRHLNRAAYRAECDRLFALYDELFAAIAAKRPFAREDELRRLLQLLMEPGMQPYYYKIAAPFFRRYLAPLETAAQ